MNTRENIERFETEFAKIEREGADAVLNYLKKYDMYTAPASTRYHLHVEGGLLQHSLNVLDALRSLLTKKEDGMYAYVLNGVEVATVTEESVIIMALLHDICKTNIYVTEYRNRKNDKGEWEKYPAYTVKDQAPYGHGEKSVMMIESFMKLTPVERYAIRWHMGFPEGNERYTFSDAVKLYPIIWALHSADMMATSFMEDDEDNKAQFC